MFLIFERENFKADSCSWQMMSTSNFSESAYFPMKDMHTQTQTCISTQVFQTPETCYSQKTRCLSPTISWFSDILSSHEQIQIFNIAGNLGTCIRTCIIQFIGNF
ncbi:hypothetical protein Peur_017215 [Populus x canadensis]